MNHAVTIVDYDPTWPAVAAQVMEEIRAACGEHLEGIEHIGSTSVPGLAAKPIIDLMPELAEFDRGFACVEPLQRLGYEYRGEYGIVGRHYFVRDERDDTPRLHVHMLVVGSEDRAKHLLFRDYLRAHPHQAGAYERLKRDLAARMGREAYTEAKTDFVLGALERARAWRSAAD